MKNELKHFWRQSGTDYRADLGIMKNAIVVRCCIDVNAFYCIGHASFFPFTNEQYDRRFESHLECCEFAEGIVISWIKSLFVNELSADALKVENTKIC